MKKCLKLILLLSTLTLLLAVFAAPAFASYASRVNSFIADERWKDGVAWGGSQQPKMPGNNQFWGCAAYACDFTRYVWGASSYHDGVQFTSYTEIRDGDVIATGGHYYVVLQRTGNTLWTAEGNYTSNGYAHVYITTSHYNAGSQAGCSISQGWHNPNYEPYQNTAILDVNGYLDGANAGDTGNYGTFDVYINGSRVKDDVNDYCAEHPAGTTYSISDIKAKNGYKFEKVQSGATSGTLGNTRINVVLSFTSYATLDVKGLLDKAASDTTSGFGTFDVYINGSLDASGVTDYNKKWPQGTTYQIKNIQAINGKYYNGVTSGKESGTLGKGTTSPTLSFSTIAQAGPEWREESELPGYIDPSTVEIEYKNHYEKTATSSPGTGWVQVAGSGVTTYVNDGGVREFNQEQQTSNTCVYVGSYYYHYCGSSKSDVNYEYTSEYNTYHNVGDVNSYAVMDSWADFADASYICYKVKWVSGQWAGGEATCSSGKPGVYYRKWQYQYRKAVTNYKWTKDSDWGATKDSAANSTTVRFRLKKYDVTFDVNGGDSVPENMVKYHGIDLTLTEEPAVKALFRFTGWNTQADGKGEDYAAGGVYTGDAALKLYAQWEPLTRLVLPADLTAIEYQAFAEIDAAVVEVQDKCESIGAEAFLNCANLEAIYIPASVTSISFDAFDGCSKVTIYAPENSTAMRFAKALGMNYKITD